MISFRAGIVGLILFVTGMCALIYQTIWMREFRLFFGGSTAATAAVLAIFMGGLGAGGLILGRWVDRIQQPLRLYALLELMISAAAAITPILLICVGWLYLAIGGSTVLGTAIATILRLLLAVIVIGFPAFLMGGTLPAAARAVEREDDESRRDVALLYGFNTLGAVVGVVLATFWWIEAMGQRGTLLFACGINALAGAAALALARRFRNQKRSHRDATKAVAQPVAGDYVANPVRLVLAAAATVGFVFLLMELVWYRMLSPLLGGTTFSFGLILAVALAGIGSGGAAYAIFRSNRPATLLGFAFSCAAEAVCIAFPLLLGDRIAVLALLLRPLGAIGFSGLVVGWVVVTALTVFPAAFVAGFQFPLLIALLGRGRKSVGRHTGLAYAYNTAGAIAGSVAGGFGLLPLLSAPGAWRLSVVLLAALGVVVCVFAWRRGENEKLWRFIAPLGLTVAGLAMLLAPGPTAAWRHSPIGAGRVNVPANANLNSLHKWANEARRTLLWEADGVESSVATVSQSAVAFVVNGKIDGNARGDAGTQVMGGLLGALVHPNPERALVIGLGTGSTAGWLGAVPSMTAVDVVELEPAILTVARACAPVNRDVLANPKVHIEIGDARETLLASDKQYDIIFSEPSNPYRAGVASLFTRELYSAAAKRLHQGGIFLQWVQGYEIDEQTLKVIIATLHSVFPNIEIWQTTESDLLFAATLQPQTYDVDAMRRRVTEDPYRSALIAAWRVTDVEGVFAHYVANRDLARKITGEEDVRVNSDERNYLEFSFARSVGLLDPSRFSIPSVRQAALAIQSGRPVISTGELDWNKIVNRQISMATAFKTQVVPGGDLDPSQRARLAVHQKYGALNFAEALRLWREWKLEPEDPMELAMLAELNADIGDEAAIPYIGALRMLVPPEASLLEARLYGRRGEIEDAVRSIEAGFLACRHDPWIQPAILLRSLLILEEIAARDTDRFGHRLSLAISEPFAVSMEDERRLRSMLRVGQYIDREQDSGFTVKALMKFEPHIPWDNDFLTLRERWYRESGHPKAAAAQRDLMRFRRVANSEELLDIEASPAKTRGQ